MPLSQEIINPRSGGGPGTICGEMEKLAELSARLGSDPLLVQASSGNTSIKLDGTLWIKASGKWLARAAEEDIFVPVDLAQARARIARNERLTGAPAQGDGLQASIETAMHAVLPHRVVIHVHSVTTLAWAVRVDGRERLSERLVGIGWQWIPYVSSGFPLAQAIQKAMATAPRSSVFVLANHGVVVCGEDCESAEALLRQVESRVSVRPRETRGCDPALSAEVAGSPEWSLPESDCIHAIGTDEASLAILKAGVLYPCQAMFLGTRVPMLPESTTFARGIEYPDIAGPMPPFWVVERRGLVIGRRMSTTQLAILRGLAEVVQRIEASARLRYIDDAELAALLSEDAHCYRQCAESNARARYSEQG